jgi:hypothetical protein
MGGFIGYRLWDFAAILFCLRCTPVGDLSPLPSEVFKIWSPFVGGDIGYRIWDSWCSKHCRNAERGPQRGHCLWDCWMVTVYGSFLEGPLKMCRRNLSQWSPFVGFILLDVSAHCLNSPHSCVTTVQIPSFSSLAGSQVASYIPNPVTECHSNLWICPESHNR